MSSSDPPRPVRLYWSSRSPYARKAAIVLHELGLTSQVVHQPIVVKEESPDNEIVPLNPLAQIPTLVLSDGSAIFDSTVICRWLDAVHGNGTLCNWNIATAREAECRLALAEGMLNKLIRRLSEGFRPSEMRSEPRLAGYRRTLANGLDALERGAATWRPDAIDLSQIAVACVLGYMDFRFADDAWREGRPQLATWMVEVAKRPSLVANPHGVDLTPPGPAKT